MQTLPNQSNRDEAEAERGAAKFRCFQTQDQVLEAPLGEQEGLFMFRKGLITLALLVGSAVVANAAGDARAGAAVFDRCAVCHTNDKGGGDGLGPNLFGIVGRKAATRPGFAYSPPMRKSGLVWTDVNLTKWVAGPARLVPGTKMAFAGITSKKQQADVVAYLTTLK
jgi:cytochrome c